jgi:adenosylcobinamide-GDP ribazoletransferase
MRWIEDFLVAVQFLTRLPVPRVRFDPDSSSRAAKFFPVLGLMIGLGASVLRRIAAPHLSHPIVALLVLTFLVVITSGLHEDGLADTEDGFGGGWNREQVLTTLRDSRIGSFGALALVLSVLARFLFLSRFPVNRFTAFIVSAHIIVVGRRCP